MLIRISQPDKQAPPIVAPRWRPRFKILGCEAPPAPMVLQFIKRVLAIRTGPVELAQGENLAAQRRHQGDVFPDLRLCRRAPRQNRATAARDRCDPTAPAGE